MKKKILTVLLATIISTAMLSGCSGDENRASDEVTTQEASEPSGMVHMESSEDVIAFFEELYGGVDSNLLPGGLMTTELDLADVDAVTYHTGLDDVSGVEGIYLSESMMGSVAYSAFYIRTSEGTDVDAMITSIMDNIDPAKWICVTASKQLVSKFGNDIFYVMGADETVGAVFEQAKKCAEDSSMTVSQPIEKQNAQ